MASSPSSVLKSLVKLPQVGNHCLPVVLASAPSQHLTFLSFIQVGLPKHDVARHSFMQLDSLSLKLSERVLHADDIVAEELLGATHFTVDGSFESLKKRGLQVRREVVLPGPQDVVFSLLTGSLFKGQTFCSCLR